MSGIGSYMINHHKECDEIFARAEEAAGGADWTRAQAQFETFANQMERHFDQEDNLLFPEFEKKTGHAGGPTQVMRMEHDQMRVVMHEMRSALDAKDVQQYLGLSETFLVLMQQHNFKEEGILYNMIDQVLGDQAERLLGLMESTV
jgi:hemerythrin-like domain-containing protein